MSRAKSHESVRIPMGQKGLTTNLASWDVFKKIYQDIHKGKSRCNMFLGHVLVLVCAMFVIIVSAAYLRAHSRASRARARLPR